MKKTIIPFEEFEKTVMQKIFEKKNDLNEILNEQYSTSQIIKREFTGVGFFTYFKISEDAPSAINLIDRNYGDVIASINGSTFDFGFALFLENGIISCLEGYTWADAWPEAIHIYRLAHADKEELHENHEIK